MAKKFKDFTFNNSKFSYLLTDYISVDFDASDETSLAMSRDMELSDVNRYRYEPNAFYDAWNDRLEFRLDIMKNPCERGNQSDLVISKDEIREITRWLTSPHIPMWIDFEYDTGVDDVRYYGWFSNIETFTVGGEVIGLKLTFTCTTPWAYSYDKTRVATVSGHGDTFIINTGDDTASYTYPIIRVTSQNTAQVFICNLSDCNILKTDALGDTSYQSLKTACEEYALGNGYEIEYPNGDDVPLCDDTAVQFYLIDKYDVRTKCTGLIDENTGNYYIIEGGFLYFKTLSALPIYIDCDRLTIHDEIGRMISYDDLGIADIDYIYWPRLVNGSNHIIMHGNATFEFTHKEVRKVGE